MNFEEKSFNYAKMPPKYSNLERFIGVVPVPPLFCIIEQDFRLICDNFDSICSCIEKIIQTIHITSGAFLDENILQIQNQAKMLHFNQQADCYLIEKMNSVFSKKWLDYQYAVRSAGATEDSTEQSFAGLYKSILNVGGLDNLKIAIIEVWRSAFSKTAFAEHLNSDGIILSTGINVIVQQMIHGCYSGVAFSCDPILFNGDIIIEYVQESGEKLVSGQVIPKVLRLKPSMNISNEVKSLEFISDLKNLINKVKLITGWDVDVEWAWDSKMVWLLQVRPITRMKTEFADYDQQPQFKMVELYGDDQSAINSFGHLPDFAEYFRAKRKPLYDFAKKQGLGFGVAFIIRSNRKGLNKYNNRQILSESFKSKEVILDFNANIRQIIIPSEQLIAELEQLMTNSDRIHIITIRDFIQGEVGLITKLLKVKTGSLVICEYSSDGLLAINRGVAFSSTLFLPTKQLPGFLSASMAYQLEQATRAAQVEIGEIQIEWVYTQDKLFMVDFSTETKNLKEHTKKNENIISSGYARGEVFILKKCRYLEDLSISPSTSLKTIPDAKDMGSLFENILEQLKKRSDKPILVTPRPYAALASLIPYVKGFVFEYASLLCHLSILLREKRIPAIKGAEIYRSLIDEQRIIIDTTLEDPLCVI